MAATDTSQLERARMLLLEKEQRLAAELRAVTGERREAEQTLERLDGYLDEYNGAGSGDGAGTQSPRGLVNGRRFVSRLGTAIEQQRRQAARLVQRCAQTTTEWQRARADVAAIERMIENRQRAARLDAARREQRENDAHAQRRFATTADSGLQRGPSSTLRVEPRT